jgi:hypothetical protein
MRTRLGTTILITGMFVGAAATLRAQEPTGKADSSHHFALFGGSAAGEGYGPETGFEMGVSADLRWNPMPVPLRLSLSFSQRNSGEFHSLAKGGLASLEAVMRPIPKRFGIQPYFLAGLGLGTRAAFGYVTGPVVAYSADLPWTELPGSRRFVSTPRGTWAFASAGVGLDVGRLFIQARLLNPVASYGPVVVPVNVGFRFWD